ncbi:surface-adhesin E family protein [Halomonas ventosae]|uniref:surface-adhesin E family protein n=1 Tax=Halomonas ventosae TaxID=229007 RepID=UPI00105B73BC|nr:surface-adhesin E family protein [Halomonas ventosae]
MKILLSICFVFMILCTNFALAGWKQIASSSKVDVYVNTSDSNKTNGVAKAWVLIDHQEVQVEAGDHYLSSMGEWEFVCQEKAQRQVFHVIFSGHMGGGRTIWSGPVQRDFHRIAPGTAPELVYNMVC